jgi:hypothetical protein
MPQEAAMGEPDKRTRVGGPDLGRSEQTGSWKGGHDSRFDSITDLRLLTIAVSRWTCALVVHCHTRIYDGPRPPYWRPAHTTPSL